MTNTSADETSLDSSSSQNPFAVPTDGALDSKERVESTITRRFTILGGAAGVGYSVILLCYSLWVHYSGVPSTQVDEAPHRLIDVLLQCFLSGVGMIVILAIVGAGVGTIVEIMVPSPPLPPDSIQSDDPR